ncbi:hypothetical protein N9A49_05810 [Salibacteraceae bacterium]|jgi:hypothetical protein|nr:hypothetical protein [Salibacteraceae bacterium]MDB4104965.1 hypothetical protein [Salibacteraceae bacterium]MDB9708296.1 hypothetical protein [Salibacteraceae bacterium]MDC1304700.1 hypothetical protein [Salibacteraceae bacterium]
MSKKLPIFFAFVILSGVLFAQSNQSILLMTGNVLEGNVTSQDTLYLYYDLVKKSGKTKAKKLDLERVFSINGPNGEEKVIYYMDTVVGNYFTIDEMRFYIQGEQDASKYYRANWTIAAGLPITAGLGFVLSGTVFSFAVPFVYLVSTGISAYKINKNKISSSHLVTEPAYVLGYERTARNKRLFKSLFAGLVGTAIGFTLGQDIIK